MSLVREYFIKCNFCHRVCGQGDVTSAIARRNARRNGWKRVKGSTSMGKDACPRCARERGIS